MAFLDGAQPQVWVSDRWKPQLAAGAAREQICLGHQLRDVEYARQAETGEARQAARAWAVAMAALLRRAIHTRNEHAADRRAAPTDADAVVAIAAACDALLAQPVTAGGSHDRQTRFLVHRRGLLTLLHDLTVPPTNNASERRLRPAVVHRKVTGGVRSEAFATGSAALRTVADTARKRGQRVFAQLLDAAGSPLPLTTHLDLTPP